MSEVIERAARRIRRMPAGTAIREWFDGRGGDEQAWAMDMCREVARTVIEEMREPTVAMLEAGEYTSPNIVSPSFARDLYTAMICAALGQPAPT